MIDWSLLGPPVDVGAHFTAGLERGRAMRKRAETESALAAYAQRPDDPAALSALIQADPQMGMRARDDQTQRMEMQQKEQAKAQEASRKNILMGAQIVRQIQPKDQAGWDQARAAAAQVGIDVSSVPAQFDPRYAEQLIAAADAFEPERAEASQYQFIPYQPGGGVLRADRRLGTTTELIRANDGSAPAGAPVADGPATPAPANTPDVTDQASYDAVPPGATYRTPDGNLRMKPGGPTQPASGRFRP